MEGPESLGGGVKIYVSRAHRFGTDGFLLSDFCAAERGEVAADLCSGCGIVALLWYRERERAPARCHCVEVQPEAAALLERSAGESGLQGEILPLCRDLRSLTRKDIPSASCDLVSCNPPYKAAGRGIESAREHALKARHEALCTLPDVCACAARILKVGGRLCLCQRPERLPEVFAAMREAGIEPKRMRLVQKRGDTPPWLVLIEGRRGGRPFLKVEAPLLIQDGQGGFSAELRQIYGWEGKMDG